MRPQTYRRVYFFGAGTSRALGTPLTNEVLSCILGALAEGKLFGTHTNTRSVNVAARRELAAGLKEAFGLPLAGNASVPPVTDLFSLLDHLVAKQLSLGPRLATLRLQRLRQQLERATLWVLHNRTAPGFKRDRDLTASTAYFYRTELKRGRTCFITSNYDRMIEKGLIGGLSATMLERIDHGIVRRRYGKDELLRRPANPIVGVFKLHGSATWLGCSLCGHVYIRPEKVLYSVAYHEKPSEHSTCDCGHFPLRSVLVAPSLTRPPIEAALETLWAAAQDALREADDWTFVGYSLPNEDISIRALLSRARRSRKRPPRVTVVVRPGKCADETKRRYQFLFPGCTLLDQDFAQYLAAYAGV